MIKYESDLKEVHLKIIKLKNEKRTVNITILIYLLVSFHPLGIFKYVNRIEI